MEDNKTGVSTDLFGKERGECEVQTCGCKQFTVDKHEHGNFIPILPMRD